MNTPLLPRDTWRRAGEAADGVVRTTGLTLIARRLSTASEGDDGAALAGFRQADQIRRQVGCSWADLIAGKAP